MLEAGEENGGTVIFSGDSPFPGGVGKTTTLGAERPALPQCRERGW